VEQAGEGMASDMAFMDIVSARLARSPETDSARFTNGRCTPEVDQLRALRSTSDPDKLNHAVYGDLGVERSYVASNPYLSEQQCRDLLPHFEKDNYSRALLVENTSFPSDLLERLALEDDSALVRYQIAWHPTASENAKATAALRGTIDFLEYTLSRS
jgi:hypothetical protein